VEYGRLLYHTVVNAEAMFRLGVHYGVLCRLWLPDDEDHAKMHFKQAKKFLELALRYGHEPAAAALAPL